MRVPNLAGYSCNHGAHRHLGLHGFRCSACGATWCSLAPADCELCERRPRRWPLQFTRRSDLERMRLEAGG